MGLFWDLIQQDAINKQTDRTATLEERVAGLEIELRETRELLHAVLLRLEKHIGADLNDDGHIG